MRSNNAIKQNVCCWWRLYWPCAALGSLLASRAVLSQGWMIMAQRVQTHDTANSRLPCTLPIMSGTATQVVLETSRGS